jgi:hypothetical protein
MYKKVLIRYTVASKPTRIRLTLRGLIGKRNLVRLPEIHDTLHMLNDSQNRAYIRSYKSLRAP